MRTSDYDYSVSDYDYSVSDYDCSPDNYNDCSVSDNNCSINVYISPVDVGGGCRVDSNLWIPNSYS